MEESGERWGDAGLGLPPPPHLSHPPGATERPCRGLPLALALFLLVGWASQEQFAAISGPEESRSLTALLTAHWLAHPTCEGRKGHIRAAVFSPPQTPVPRLLGLLPYRKG